MIIWQHYVKLLSSQYFLNNSGGIELFPLNDLNGGVLITQTLNIRQQLLQMWNDWSIESIWLSHYRCFFGVIHDV